MSKWQETMVCIPLSNEPVLHVLSCLNRPHLKCQNLESLSRMLHYQHHRTLQHPQSKENSVLQRMSNQLVLHSQPKWGCVLLLQRLWIQVVLHLEPHRTLQHPQSKEDSVQLKKWKPLQEGKNITVFCVMCTLKHDPNLNTTWWRDIQNQHLYAKRGLMEASAGKCFTFLAICESITCLTSQSAVISATCVTRGTKLKVLWPYIFQQITVVKYSGVVFGNVIIRQLQTDTEKNMKNVMNCNISVQIVLLLSTIVHKCCCMRKKLVTSVNKICKLQSATLNWCVIHVQIIILVNWWNRCMQSWLTWSTTRGIASLSRWGVSKTIFSVKRWVQGVVDPSDDLFFDFSGKI